MMAKYPGCHFISAKKGEGIDSLRITLNKFSEKIYVNLKVIIRNDDSKTISFASSLLQIESSYIEDNDFIIEGKSLKSDMSKLEKFGAVIEIIENQVSN
jgi:50S ribosomal subunit-associated GTPase HflX